MSGRWLDVADRCELCGKFVRQTAPGVSWRQTWSYGAGGEPNLHDPMYRCSPCTDAHGIGPTNCAGNYSGRNAITETPAPPPLAGSAAQRSTGMDQP